MALSGDVARCYGITPQAVKKWVEAGCPVRRMDAAGRRLFDLDEVKRWVAANRVHRGPAMEAGLHGGARPGSGRKNGRPKGSGKWQRAAMAAKIGREPMPLLDGGQDEERGVSTGPTSGLVFEKTRHEQLKAQRLELELAEKRRDLLPRAEVEEAIAAAARNLASLCATMSQRLAAEVVSRAALPAGMFPVVEDLVRVECDALVEAMLAEPLGAAQVKAAA